MASIEIILQELSKIPILLGISCTTWTTARSRQFTFD